MDLILSSILASLVIILFAGPAKSYITEPTPSPLLQAQYERAKLLDEYRQTHNERDFNLADNPKIKFSNYEYMEVDKPIRITPISDDDERKYSNKYKLPRLRSTPTEPPTHQPLTHSMKLKKPKKRQPSEIYYRRAEYKNLSPTAGGNLHCHVLVTPFLAGLKKVNLSHHMPETVKADDRAVQRLIKLITLNTTNFDSQDILALIYQFSNINIRLFNWGFKPITRLLQAICNVKKDDELPTLARLKYGLKALLHSWTLEITDTSQIVKQTKIFRPPCINIGNVESSTLTASFKTFPTTVKLTTKLCFKDDDNTEYPC